MTWLVFLCALEREALSQLQEWDTNYEVAWNWLWDNVATLLATMAALVGLSVFLQLSYGLVRASISVEICFFACLEVQTLGSSYKWEASWGIWKVTLLRNHAS